MSLDRTPTSGAYEATLAGLEALEEDWDSYGATKIDPEAISATRVFLDAVLAGVIQIVPTTDGGVQVELHTGIDIEVEFRPRYSRKLLGDVAGFWER